VHEVRVRGLPREAAEVRTTAAAGAAEQDLGSRDAGEAAARGERGVPASLRAGGQSLAVTLDGRIERYAWARDGETLWLGKDGHAWALTRHRIGDPGDRPGAAGSGDGVVRSPMPGTVLVVKAQVGDRVDEGQPLLIVEAMKMEHTVTAPRDGLVTELPVQAGQPVDMDAVLAVVTSEEA
jgi:acetyl-CoA/propionyl-CoA carboxylase biotin carboxyl carrier protein